jgi:hypothetical protein
MMTARDARSMAAIGFLIRGVFMTATEKVKSWCNQGSGEKYCWLD